MPPRYWWTSGPTIRAVDVDRYLRRIGMDPQTGPPTIELLAALQLAHLTHVPFENLHVYHRRGPRTDVGWSYPKIVEQGRGGWCFELNGSFVALLRALGYDADHVSCQVFEEVRKDWGPHFDHLGGIVSLDGARWFVDVGFGDACVAPILLEPGRVSAAPRDVDVTMGPDHAILSDLMPHEGGDAVWEPQLRVSFEPRTLDEFTARSTYLQTFPGLNWQEHPFATRALDGDGSRVTLRRDGSHVVDGVEYRVLRRRSGRSAYVDTPVSPDEWSATLLEHFGLVDSLRD